MPYGDKLVAVFKDSNSPEISKLKNNLALRYSDLGEYEKARDLLEEALKSDLDNFGNKHPNVAVSQSNLANVYIAIGNKKEVLKLWESAFKILLNEFGIEHPNTQTVREFLDHYK